MEAHVVYMPHVSVFSGIMIAGISTCHTPRYTRNKDLFITFIPCVYSYLLVGSPWETHSAHCSRHRYNNTIGLGAPFTHTRWRC